MTETVPASELTLVRLTDVPTGAAMRDALSSCATPFIAFVSADDDHTPATDKAIDHATTTAVNTGLRDVVAPLLIPKGWHEAELADSWRVEIMAQHPAAQAELASAVDAYLLLTAFRTASATLHGLDVVSGGTVLRLTGNCRRTLADGEHPPEHDIRLVMADADGHEVARLDTAPALRVEGGRTTWVGFTADIPLAELPVGRLALAVVLRTPTGHEDVRRPVNATIGMLSSSRAVTAGARRFQALQVGASYKVEIVSQKTSSAVSRVAWSASMAMRDLRSFVRRRPFTWVRPVRAFTRPFFARRTVWIVGERQDTARDNGYHLFAHLRHERKDIRAYYVIDRDSDQRERLAGLGRVVAHSSWRHRLLMLHADVLAGAYSIKHMVPTQWNPDDYLRHAAWRIGSHRVYLKHGVNVNTAAFKRRLTGYDLYLTAVEGETVAARLTSGYDHQIVQTGLPRYDALEPTPPSRTVLFMPTWRAYLVPRLFGDEEAGTSAFEGSDYQRFVDDFLTSPRLHAMLAEHHHDLQFMPHYNLREHLAGVKVSSERITVLDGGAADIQEVMRACDLFVTDHSSVHFDLAYLGTPVVYSHFDVLDYRKGHADTSWFDHERDGFGPVAYDLDSTLDAIEHYLVTGCRREEQFTRRAEAAFAFHDRDNCRRAVASIEELLRTGGGT